MDGKNVAVGLVFFFFSFFQLAFALSSLLSPFKAFAFVMVVSLGLRLVCTSDGKSCPHPLFFVLRLLGYCRAGAICIDASLVRLGLGLGFRVRLFQGSVFTTREDKTRLDKVGSMVRTYLTLVVVVEVGRGLDLDIGFGCLGHGLGGSGLTAWSSSWSWG